MKNLFKLIFSSLLFVTGYAFAATNGTQTVTFNFNSPVVINGQTYGIKFSSGIMSTCANGPNPGTFICATDSSGKLYGTAIIFAMPYIGGLGGFAVGELSINYPASNINFSVQSSNTVNITLSTNQWIGTNPVVSGQITPN